MGHGRNGMSCFGVNCLSGDWTAITNTDIPHEILTYELLKHQDESGVVHKHAVMSEKVVRGLVMASETHRHNLKENSKQPPT